MDVNMKHTFTKTLEDCPVIAALKDNEGLEQCLSSESSTVFILYGDILTISDIVNRVKECGKLAMVHVDLISGLSSKEISVDFIKKHTKADGIISTKPMLIKRAKELSLYTVLRFFVIDSMAYENIEKQCMNVKPDCIEILPGIMPKVIKKICNTRDIPVIAGGLISDKEDIMQALDAGAVSISTTNPKVWFM
ncbi:glycerol-3-phosphate responsive antiterminator, GlpP [Lachnoclostridium phytofermentans ISDg]|uniref:Glycerol-3-phosphate responsive antiterminator, GlpP n=2 Tax=Lachnoclostridium phytofermentans TaxID=66219 RepID=A9KSR2_LACP7|nr:glycerol-3-phosphate responsive antiterminator, GlpP [Lachnoclostridium phytofermentans ISDg]